MRLSYRQRLLLLSLLAAFVGGTLVIRLCSMQLAGAGYWRREAERQVAAARAVHAARGRILDAKGRELAADEVGFELTVRAAAWRAVMHECPRCGQVRFYHSGERPGICSRCRQKRYVPVDRRDVSRVAALLDVATVDLIRRIESQTQRVERIVRKKLRECPPRRLKQQRAMLWADYGWRPRRIARDVPYEVAREIEIHPHENPAFKIQTVHMRRAVGGREFVHILGNTIEELERVDADGIRIRVEVPTGSTGLEAAFDDVLRGDAGWLRILRDPRGGEGRVVARHAPRPGDDIRLTIAAEDQARAMMALDGVAGALVVVDAWKGDVLAAASAPAYEPGDYGSALEEIKRQRELTGHWPRHHALREAAFRDFHAPGSIMKPFTAIAALTAGVETPERTITCDHYFTNSRGQRLSSFKCNGQHGSLDLHDALVRSCNIYFQTLQREMIETQTLDRFISVARKFGLGQPTGIELEPDPFPDTYRLGNTWADYIGAAIGQGRVEVSAAQIARAYAALATGFLPRLRVAAVVAGHEIPPERAPLGIPEGVLRPVREALRDVPRNGTAAGHGLERWPVSVKTGTAQLVGAGAGPLYNAWIAGYAPAHAGRPAIAFALVVFETDEHGGEACAPRLAAFLRGFYEGSSE